MSKANGVCAGAQEEVRAWLQRSYGELHGEHFHAGVCGDVTELERQVDALVAEYVMECGDAVRRGDISDVVEQWLTEVPS